MHISAFGAALRTPDLRKKILFTIGLLAVYRLGSVVPTPGVDYAAIQRCIDVVQDNSVYALINLFSGGALLQLSVFALGIMPYITASIILQLLTVVIPRLETLKKDGQAGQAKITQYTRYVTIGLAILQSTAILSLARTPGALFSGCNESLIPNQSIWVILVMIIVMTAGTAVIMWFGELITERGVGNGMSLLIFTSIIATIPAQFASVWGSQGPFTFSLTLLIGLAIIAFVVFVEQAQRRIPVQYAKRMVGRRMYGGTSTYIPLKVNMAGVIPVIFASSLLFLPILLVQLTGSQAEWAHWVAAEPRHGHRHLVPGAVLRPHHLLLLLLRLDHVQPGRGRRQHEEVRRLHPRHPGRPADRRVPRLRPHPPHGSRARSTSASSPSCRSSPSASSAWAATSSSAAPAC